MLGCSWKLDTRFDKLDYLNSDLIMISNKVTILESSGRRGGRMKTYRGKTLQGDEWYGDLGAMRFPGEKGQPIINKVNILVIIFFSKYQFLRYSMNLIYAQLDLLISM